MSVDGRSSTAIEAPASLRVLIAENDVELRAVLAQSLTATGHVIVGDASTMPDALQQARELSPDVLLLDAQLGPTQLLDAAKTLAHDCPGVAVIFLCGESTFAIDGDVADTTAISVLPSSCPAALLASSVRLAVQRMRELRAARDEVLNVRQQLENRKAIERAKGILMRRTGLSEQEAYRILQRTSQDRSVPMVDVAREVLESEPGR